MSEQPDPRTHPLDPRMRRAFKGIVTRKTAWRLALAAEKREYRKQKQSNRKP